MLARAAQVEAGQFLSQAETAKQLSITPQTVSIWNRDDRFVEWYAVKVHKVRSPLVELAKTMIVVKTLQGNPKFADLFLRMFGYFDGPSDPAPGVSAVAGQQVHIHGIVAIPSREEAQRMLPPSGSNVIMDCPPPPAELVAAIEEQKRRDLTRS